MSDHKGTEDQPKSILKESSDRRTSKTFQWDEMNIIATYHPADKSYGHMKVDEPDTPYNFEYDSTESGGVNPNDLANLLEKATETLPKMMKDSSHDADAKLTPEELKHRQSFEQKRKHHYNEFQAVHKIATHVPSDDDTSNPDDEVDPVAARNTELNAQLGKSRPFGNLHEK